MMDQEQKVTEVRETNTTDGVTNVQERSEVVSEKVSGVTLAKRVVWFIAGFIIVLLALRIVLQLLGANDAAGFVNFIYSISQPFAAPFYGMFPEPTRGVSTLDVSSIFAILIYSLVAWGIAKLITLTRPHPDAEV